MRGLRGVERDQRRSLCGDEADLRRGLSGLLRAEYAQGHVGQVCRGIYHFG
jgi:hypothetical protein